VRTAGRTAADHDLDAWRDLSREAGFPGGGRIRQAVKRTGEMSDGIGS
jgi:hypothetical protein